MSARVKRGTNITGKADRSVSQCAKQRKRAVGFYPPEKAKKTKKNKQKIKSGKIRLEKRQKGGKGAGWVWEGNQIVLMLNNLLFLANDNLKRPLT